MDKWELHEWVWETLLISQFCYAFSPCFCEADPHSWVINRQIREAGSVAWLALTNLTAAAWLEKWLQAGMEYPEKQRRETLELYSTV